jgi:hypothetical protein
LGIHHDTLSLEKIVLGEMVNLKNSSRQKHQPKPHLMQGLTFWQVDFWQVDFLASRHFRK